jgi:hypothetical protein
MPGFLNRGLGGVLKFSDKIKNMVEATKQAYSKAAQTSTKKEYANDDF